MKRFFNNESDDFFDKEQAEELDEAELAAYIEEDELMELLEEHINNLGLNQDLLKVAVSLAESKWFWNWRTEASQMKVIERIYHSLREMRDHPNPKKEEKEADAEL